MNDSIDVVFADHTFNFVVITDISLDKWNIRVVLGAKVLNTGFKALVERVIDND